MYVWFDALTNYVTALGYGGGPPDRLYERYWRESPVRVHVTAGSERAAQRLDTVLYELAEACRLVSEGLRPLLPDAAERIAAALGASPASCWGRGLEWGGLQPGRPVARLFPLFPRRDAREPPSAP